MFVEALIVDPDAATTQHYVPQLDAYIAAQLTGEPYLERFPAVTIHLDGCVTCAEAYARLYELALADSTETLAEPHSMPEPDLSFLQPFAIERLGAQLRDALHWVGERLTLQFTPELLPALRMQPALGSVRAPADEERYGEIILRLTPEQTGNIWPASITAYRDKQHPSTCLIEVEVQPPGRSWPDLGEIGVAIRLGDQSDTTTTDAWGLAVFANVPVEGLAEMQIAVDLDHPHSPSP